MIKINIGCGKTNFGESWLHVDKGNFSHVSSDDFSLYTHFDNSVDLIYCSHMFEYMDRQQGIELLKNWFFKLKSGGILRIAVPDFREMSYLYSVGKIELKNILGPLYCKMKINDDFIYHKTTYDYKDLSEMLREVGFENVKRYDFRNTEHSEIDDCSKAHLPHDPEAIRTGIFTPQQTLISLNVEATKI